MMGPDRLFRVSADALIPEQIITYVHAVTGARPRMLGECLSYESGQHLVLIGYPLSDPLDHEAMVQAVDRALKKTDLGKITVIGPSRPPQAPADINSSQDDYHELPIPTSPPSSKLKNLLRRARRDLIIENSSRFENEHQKLVNGYLAEKTLAAGTRQIFQKLPDYLEASSECVLFSARTSDGDLAAFVIGDYTSLHTAFFMFCSRNPGIAAPGSTDLLFSKLLEEAERRGHSRVNLGLGINEGIRFFKRKWKSRPFLPCIETSWEISNQGQYSADTHR